MQATDFLQLTGHPLRWNLLSELARSDRTVAELTGLVDEKQNLVSYHLGKLRDAGLVVARRSSADGRDTYYAADLPRFATLLSATAGALHPGLGVPPTPAGQRSRRRRKTKVLFACTGNSARSQMAAALLNARAGDVAEAVSAGSHPKVLHPLAVEVLRDDYGIDISKNKTTALDAYAAKHFDWVITLCDKVREVCPEFDSARPVHWSIADPAQGDRAAFEQLAAELESRIGFLLAVLND